MEGSADDSLVTESTEDFVLIGAKIMRQPFGNATTNGFLDCWTCHFQVAPLVVEWAWQLITAEPTEKGARPDHLLWACLLLKLYENKAVLSGMCHIDEDTLRKWSRYFVSRLADLEPEVIVWENCKLGDQAHDCLTNYDGINCRTTKQGPSGKAFYSHKFKSSGLQYGVASSIVGCNIVHVDGLHPPGNWNDLTCFRKYLNPKLEPGERVEADGGYLVEDPGDTPPTLWCESHCSNACCLVCV
ncbi:hypothetical protein ACA910_010001 [Epithemia clementina (nom. ined.)]